MAMLRIKQFEVTNFRGIAYFKAAPEGKSLIIKGANGTGKTSLLNALVYAFTGEVFSGLANNLQRYETDAFNVSVTFLVGRAKHTLSVSTKAKGKIEFQLNKQTYDVKSKYLQALADLIGLDDYNALIDLIHPLNVEMSLGVQNNLATKQLREAFIRAINQKEQLFDSNAYLELKTQISYKEETQKLLEKEFHLEDEFAKKFRTEHNLNEAPKSAEEIMQERTILENDLANYENRNTLRNRLESINARISDLETKLDPQNTALLTVQATALTWQEWILMVLTFGLYRSALKRRQNRATNELNEQQKTLEQDYEKLLHEKDQTERAMIETPDTTETNIENLKTRIRQIETQTSELERNRDRYQQILRENKDVKNQIEELMTEVKLLRVEKATLDARVQRAAHQLLPSHIDVDLFNDRNEEILDLKVNQVSFENLNTGEQVRIVSALNELMANEYQARTFIVVDRFETLSNFNSQTQVIAAQVSNDKTLVAQAADFSTT